MDESLKETGPGTEDPTSWQMILAAGAGNQSQQRRFVGRYDSLIRSTLQRRWRTRSRSQFIDDACQEVFVECFRRQGVLEKMREQRPRRFRAFLVGVIINVARISEQRRRRVARDGEEELGEHLHAPDEDRDLLAWFEKQWARSVFKDALQRLADHDSRAPNESHSASQLLELRFQDGLPIREIARRWQVPADHVHRDYARARKQFHECLKAAVQVHDDLTPTELEAECRQLTTLIR